MGDILRGVGDNSGYTQDKRELNGVNWQEWIFRGEAVDEIALKLNVRWEYPPYSVLPGFVTGQPMDDIGEMITMPSKDLPS